MRTNPTAIRIFRFRQISGVLAALGMAAGLYALSWAACRYVVPCWPAQVIPGGCPAAEVLSGR